MATDTSHLWCIICGIETAGRKYCPRCAEQPAPIPTSNADVWETLKTAFPALAEQRQAKGLATYGTPLTAGNGRNALVDLRDELLDALVYCQQLFIERGEVATQPQFTHSRSLPRDACPHATETVAALRARLTDALRLAESWQGTAEQLRAWKESATEVEREWDCQAVARMLGATLGQSCRKVIAEKVPALLAEVERLRAEKPAAAANTPFWIKNLPIPPEGDAMSELGLKLTPQLEFRFQLGDLVISKGGVARAAIERKTGIFSAPTIRLVTERRSAECSAGVQLYYVCDQQLFHADDLLPADDFDIAMAMAEYEAAKDAAWEREKQRREQARAAVKPEEKTA